VARLVSLASLLGLLWACGAGSTGTPAVPTHPAPARAAGPTAPPSPAGPSTRADLTAVIQAVLDLPALAPYWHAELADRHPLLLAESGTTRGLSLQMFGEPVQLVALDQVGARAYFQVKDVNLLAGEARVSFEYPAEGLAGTASFVRRPAGWRLVAQDIAER